MSDLMAERAALLRQVAELQAQVEALRADAERYRWLKSRPVEVPTSGPDLALWSFCQGESIRGQAADDAIDAARKEGD